MGIEAVIESLEIDFEELTGYEEKTVKEIVGAVKYGQEIIKIEITSAIFIYRQYIEENANQITVDVIPFHHIKGCKAVLKDEAENETFGIAV